MRRIHLDKEQLKKLYLQDGLSDKAIALKLGVGAETVFKRRQDYNIKRSQSETLKIRWSRTLRKYPISKQHLEELYINQKLSSNEISEQTEIDRTTIWKLLHQYQIPIRSQSEAHKLVAVSGRQHFLSGPDKPNWRGGRTTDGEYIKCLCKGHPRANQDGYVFEHILIWEQTHNQPVPPGWVIHHLNGIKTDNRPENLIAIPKSKHWAYIPALKQRVRELEAKVKLLERALDNEQLIWWSDN